MVKDNLTLEQLEELKIIIKDQIKYHKDCIKTVEKSDFLKLSDLKFPPSFNITQLELALEDIQNKIEMI